jgi:hypothetical protein
LSLCWHWLGHDRPDVVFDDAFSCEEERLDEMITDQIETGHEMAQRAVARHLCFHLHVFFFRLFLGLDLRGLGV